MQRIAGNLAARAKVKLNVTPIRAQSGAVEKIEVFVDNKKILVDPGMTILQACALVGVDIPRFCYHDRLSIAGNCRMCLVEVEKSIKPVASCAMPVMKGMKIKTNTDFVKKAREGVMEFLLQNHPLDCPICDQGGECDLQDQAMAFGSDRGRLQSRFDGKRAVEDKDIGPLVKTVMTRCIQCTRCVRFANEVADFPDFGTTGRGSDLQIGTYVEKFFASELSGNIIDICPVGALTNKPYSFMARPWETRKTESVDVMDGLGSNVILTHRTGELLRVIPRINDDINEEWISDRTRFAVDGLRVQRLLQPMIKGTDGQLKPATWEEALYVVATKMHEVPADEKAAVVGGLNDVESMTALKDLFNRFNSENVMTEEEFPTSNGGTDLRANYILNNKVVGIEEADALLLVGTNPRFEAAALNARIRKAFLYSNIEIGVIGAQTNLTYDYEYLGNNAKALDDVLAGKGEFAKKLLSAQRPAIVVGSDMLQGPNGAALLSKLQALSSKLTNANSVVSNVNVLQRWASQVGALDIGYKAGTSTIRKKPIKFLYLLGADEGKVTRQDLAPSAFVVYQGHTGDAGAEMADVIFPGAAYTEKEGTYVNTEGRSQKGYPAVRPPGEARDDWKIIRALSEVARHTLPYDDIVQIRQRMNEVAPHLLRFRDVESPAFGLSLSRQLGQDTGSVDLNVTPKQLELADFYMSNSIARCSSSMAQARKAALAAKENPYMEEMKLHAHA
ncbi:hypothetical protein WR25_05790 [Diploscapter pachys]|uniref:NADH-ubiquinone oxidoreductase 75 kDa subunit, mitochondrial n=1 Tax=Diploscapter pachys TaxID=2018661 RepID=A0A2A2K5R5_9BILA|nr:hypothetical protein WR25_05790 [Diploscapter pachys]